MKPDPSITGTSGVGCGIRKNINGRKVCQVLAYPTKPILPAVKHGIGSIILWRLFITDRKDRLVFVGR